MPCRMQSSFRQVLLKWQLYNNNRFINIEISQHGPAPSFSKSALLSNEKTCGAPGPPIPLRCALRVIKWRKGFLGVRKQLAGNYILEWVQNKRGWANKCQGLKHVFPIHPANEITTKHSMSMLSNFQALEHPISLQTLTGSYGRTPGWAWNSCSAPMKSAGVASSGHDSNHVPIALKCWSMSSWLWPDARNRSSRHRTLCVPTIIAPNLAPTLFFTSLLVLSDCMRTSVLSLRSGEDCAQGGRWQRRHPSSHEEVWQQPERDGHEQ